MSTGNKLNKKTTSNTETKSREVGPKTTPGETKSEDIHPGGQTAEESNSTHTTSSDKQTADENENIDSKEIELGETSLEQSKLQEPVFETSEDATSTTKGPTPVATEETVAEDFNSKGSEGGVTEENSENIVENSAQKNVEDRTVDSAKKKGNKKKSVGFAPPPEEDLKDHHDRLKKKTEEKRMSNLFQKIPPELSYLQKKPEGPKPLHAFATRKPGSKERPQKELGDLRNMSIKEISLQNKETELNFNYPSIHLPIQPHYILVDVKFGSLNSFDLAKVNNYILNLSNTKVGLGYEFSGEIIEVGANYQLEYSVGSKVFGCVNPMGRKGALSTNLLINPTKDILITVEDQVLEKIENVNIELSFKNIHEGDEFEIDSTSSSSLNSEVEASKKPTNLHNKLANFAIDEELPPLGKLAAFPLLYCRAKQALDHSNSVIESTGKVCILINGADTNLGFTIIQLLNSSVYSKTLNELNLILTIRESSYDRMTKLVKYFTKGKYFDPSRKKRFHLVTFDMANEDLVLRGEKPPINYKKPELFASDVLNALFGNSEETINNTNVTDHKLDLIIDITGSKKYFQTLSIRFAKLESLSLPYLSKISSDTTLSQVLKANTREPFLVKILKPRSYNSCFVSCCKFNLSLPSYKVDDVFDYINNEFSINPWSMKWSRNIANSLSNYRYYEELQLRIEKTWVLEGLNLLLEDELKFRIDDFTDWRNDFKKYIKLLKKDDGKVIFKIEDF